MHEYLPNPTRFSKIKFNERIKKRFPKAVIGLSDHTKDNYCSYAALGLGASIIEKHFIDTKNRKGPDVSASMDTKNFKDLIEASKTIYASLKYNGPKKITKPEIVTSKFAFASVVSIKSLKKGEKFSKKNIWVKRPGTGEIPAKNFFSILGKRSKVDIPEGIYIKKNSFNKMKKIIFITSTRADFGKIKSIITETKKVINLK